MKSASSRTTSSSKRPPLRAVTSEPQCEAVPQAAEAAPDAQRESLIRQAAYSVYLRRGCTPGHALQDWLEAEMEVERQLAALPQSQMSDATTPRPPG